MLYEFRWTQPLYKILEHLVMYNYTNINCTAMRQSCCELLHGLLLASLGRKRVVSG